MPHQTLGQSDASRIRVHGAFETQTRHKAANTHPKDARSAWAGRAARTFRTGPQAVALGVAHAIMQGNLIRVRPEGAVDRRDARWHLSARALGVPHPLAWLVHALAVLSACIARACSRGIACRRSAGGLWSCRGLWHELLRRRRRRPSATSHRFVAAGASVAVLMVPADAQKVVAAAAAAAACAVAVIGRAASGWAARRRLGSAVRAAGPLVSCASVLESCPALAAQIEQQSHDMLHATCDPMH